MHYPTMVAVAIEDGPVNSVKPSLLSVMTAIGLKETRLLALKIATRTPYSDSAYVEPFYRHKSGNCWQKSVNTIGLPIIPRYMGGGSNVGNVYNCKTFGTTDSSICCSTYLECGYMIWIVNSSTIYQSSSR